MGGRKLAEVVVVAVLARKLQISAEELDWRLQKVSVEEYFAELAFVIIERLVQVLVFG